MADKEAANLEKLSEQLDMLDQRLDNIDSIVSALVERVMKQSVILNVTCSRCGHSTEIAIVGVPKPAK